MIITFLIVEGNPHLTEMMDIRQCWERLRFAPLWTACVLTLLTFSHYTTIALIYYIVFWKNRHAIRITNKANTDIRLESNEATIESPLLHRQASIASWRKRSNGDEDEEFIFLETAHWNRPRINSRYKKRKKSSFDEADEV